MRCTYAKGRTKGKTTAATGNRKRGVLHTPHFDRPPGTINAYQKTAALWRMGSCACSSVRTTSKEGKTLATSSGDGLLATVNRLIMAITRLTTAVARLIMTINRLITAQFSTCT